MKKGIRFKGITRSGLVLAISSVMILVCVSVVSATTPTNISAENLSTEGTAKTGGTTGVTSGRQLATTEDLQNALNKLNTDQLGEKGDVKIEKKEFNIEEGENSLKVKGNIKVSGTDINAVIKVFMLLLAMMLAAIMTAFANFSKKNEDDKLKVEEDKTNEPKVEEDKTEEPKVEEDKTNEPKLEEDKTNEPKLEEDKTEEPKVEEDKTNDIENLDKDIQMFFEAMISSESSTNSNGSTNSNSTINKPKLEEDANEEKADKEKADKEKAENPVKNEFIETDNGITLQISVNQDGLNRFINSIPDAKDLFKDFPIVGDVQ
jgi:hypothetical protein